MKKNVRDNLPIICAAGKEPAATHGDLGKFFKSYTQNEAAEHITKNRKKAAKILRDNSLRRGINDIDKMDRRSSEEIIDVKNLIEPVLHKFRFKEFEEIFFENLYYQSSKRGPLGKTTYSNSAPVEIINKNSAFGRRYEKQHSPRIFPNKKFSEIINESIVGHKNYITSHGSYFPSEQRCRNYDLKSFDPDKRFGVQGKPDLTGKNVKRVLNPQIYKTSCIMTTVQDAKLKRDRSQIATHKPNQDIKIDPNFIYGHRTKADLYPGKLLIQNLPICEKLEELNECMAHIHKKRAQFKRRRDIYFLDIMEGFRELDSEKTGFLPWDLLYDVLHQHHVLVDITKMKVAAIYFGLTAEENTIVEYDKFLKLLMTGHPLPKLPNMVKHEESDPSLLTTYREACTDFFRYPPISSTSPRTDKLPILQYPSKIGVCYSGDLPELGLETTISTLITPSVPIQFGLSHRDYLLPRSEEDIRAIFKPLIGHLKNDDFQKMWNAALNEASSRDNQVSVEAFKLYLNKYNKVLYSLK